MARKVRIHPVRWVNHISMRVEFYGRTAGMIHLNLICTILFFVPVFNDILIAQN